MNPRAWRWPGWPGWQALAKPRVLGVLGVVVVVLTLVVLRLGDDGADGVLTAGSTSTTSVETTTTSAAPAVDLTPDEATSSSTVAIASTTTTTALVCVNSRNPKCGPFRWEPAVTPDQPIVATVTRDPAEPVVGQPVTFTVEATDADGQPVWCEVYDLGDGTSKNSVGAPCPAGGPNVTPCTGNRYGPWTPPARKGGVYRYQVTHAYAAPGTYTVRFFSYSEDAGDCHPYGSKATTTFNLVVTAGTTTTSSTSTTTTTAP